MLRIEEELQEIFFAAEGFYSITVWAVLRGPDQFATVDLIKDLVNKRETKRINLP